MNSIENTIEFDSEIGIFSEGYEGRLDIGEDAMKKKTPASHNSWATRVRFKRIDGPSEGPVRKDHIVGIYSEKGEVRLDIGSGSLKKTVSPTHSSWATRLKISPVKKTDRTILHYGDVVGIFSIDGKYRLDLGSDAVKHPADPNHNSWATRLKIQYSDPIVELSEIYQVDYDLSNAKILDTTSHNVYSEKITNKNDTLLHYKKQETVVNTDSWSWSEAVSVKVSGKETTEVSIPTVAKEAIELTITAEFRFNDTKTHTKTREVFWEVSFDVKPGEAVEFDVIQYESKINVPYKVSGSFKRLSGIYTKEIVTGFFTGINSHNMVQTLTPINTDGTKGICRVIVPVLTE